MKPIYHYTIGARLSGIIESEEIKPAVAGVVPPEIPAVWLSTAPVWEATATKGIIGDDGVRRDATIEEMIVKAGPLVRIEIDPRKVQIIYPVKLREKLRIRKDIFQSLAQAARDVGADPMEWRAVAGPIPWDAFLGIEICNECSPLRWVDVSTLAAEQAAIPSDDESA